MITLVQEFLNFGQRIQNSKVTQALNRMQNKKVVGSNNIPIKV